MPTTTGKIYLGDKLVAGGAAAPAEDWVRPSDWPALPAVADTDQVFYGLHAVFDHESNFATIRCQGAFTVDWGDGSSPVNVASNTTAEYNYSYAAAGLGAVTSRGYKTAIVTVTPQAGQTLSAIDLGQKHTQSGLVNGHSSQWLDMRLAMNNVGTVTTFVNTTWLHRLLERFEWVGGSSVQTSFASFLRDCSLLRSLPLFNTGEGTSFNFFLAGCSSLSVVPLFNTGKGTNFNNFMQVCPSLLNPPLFNTAQGTTFRFFYLFNSSLQSIPLYNVSLGQDFTSFCESCVSLQSIPALNFTAGTNLSSLLSACASMSRIQATFPASLNINLASRALGPAALNEIYTNLPTASGTPTITVTGNWGTAAHDPTIATNKGWTVTA
jgi:hypothetical protein